MAVPCVVGEGLGFIVQTRGLEVVPGCTVGQVLKILASAMTRAIIGASGTLASLSFIAIKAGTFTSVTLADASPCTFQILVEVAVHIRSVNPGNFIRAHSLRAVSTVMGQPYTPVIIANADIISGA